MKKLMKAKTLKVFRVRRYSGHEGGSNFYHHADVISTHYQTALKAARDGLIRNWRWVDTYDTSDETYVDYEYLYVVDWDRADRPAPPGMTFHQHCTHAK